MTEEAISCKYDKALNENVDVIPLQGKHILSKYIVTAFALL